MTLWYRWPVWNTDDQLRLSHHWCDLPPIVKSIARSLQGFPPIKRTNKAPHVGGTITNRKFSCTRPEGPREGACIRQARATIRPRYPGHASWHVISTSYFVSCHGIHMERHVWWLNIRSRPSLRPRSNRVNSGLSIPSNNIHWAAYKFLRTIRGCKCTNHRE